MANLPFRSCPPDLCFELGLGIRNEYEASDSSLERDIVYTATQASPFFECRTKAGRYENSLSNGGRGYNGYWKDISIILG